MSLLKELLLTEGKRGKGRKLPKVADTEVPDNARNNFAAKNSVNKSGAGAHVDKQGDKAPRERQKRNWKKEARQDY